jgi:hypothetical protein
MGLLCDRSEFFDLEAEPVKRRGSRQSKKKWVNVNDRMQKDYRYELTDPVGRNFDPEFKPELTPAEMLSLGVFCGKYMTDCRKEFPASWFKKAKLSPRGRDCSLNYFGVDASRPLSEWRANGWLNNDDPRGWFLMVLPLLHGQEDAAGGQTADQALEGLSSSHQSDQNELRARRSVLPSAAKAGAAALGLR